MSLTYDTVPFSDFGIIFKGALARRRLFLSACSIAQETLAKKLFDTHETSPYSVTGPCEDIDFSAAAAIWANLYSLLFRLDTNKVQGAHIREYLSVLCKLNEAPFVYFGRISQKPYFEASRLGD